MVDKNDPLLREVDEELRREQWAKLWDNYGIYLIGCAALVVALVGGYQFWQARQKAIAEASGAQYEAAAELARAGKADAATQAFQEIAVNGETGYAALAELTLAGRDLKDGKRAEALATFDKIAHDSRGDELIRSFAALQAAALRLGEADLQEMKDRLAPLASDDGPWRYSARELVGMAEIKAGKIEEARATFTPLLTDPQVPQSLRERVQRSMSAIATAEIDKSAAKPAAAEKEKSAEEPKAPAK